MSKMIINNFLLLILFANLKLSLIIIGEDREITRIKTSRKIIEFDGFIDNIQSYDTLNLRIVLSP